MVRLERKWFCAPLAVTLATYGQCSAGAPSILSEETVPTSRQRRAVYRMFTRTSALTTPHFVALIFTPPPPPVRRPPSPPPRLRRCALKARRAARGAVAAAQRDVSRARFGSDRRRRFKSSGRRRQSLGWPRVGTRKATPEGKETKVWPSGR